MQTQSESTTNRGHARRVALLVLARAFPGRLALVATFALLTGVLPAIFAVLIAQIIQILPAVVASGWDTSDGRRIIGLLGAVAGVLVAQEIVAAARELSVTNLYRRYDEYLLARVMHTTLRVPKLELFEHPALAAKTDRAVRIARFGPGELVGGLSAQWSARAQGLAAVVLVATVMPLAAIVLAAVWFIVGRQLQADYYRANPFWADPLRRARYFKLLALMPPWAKEVRIFGLADWLRDRFGQQWALVMHELWRGQRVDQRTMAVLLGLVAIANGVVVWLAVRAALDGSLPIGPLTVLVQGLFGMASLANLEGDIWIENGAVPVPDVLTFEQAAAPYIPTSTGDVGAAGHPAHEIRFEDVRFSYPGREPVYDGLDLRIDAGRSLAVVGLNGAGKTTLIKLLAGLEEPTAGRITVDGTDLATIDQQSWRRTVAAIFQDFVRYELSARDNIGYGAVEALYTADADARIAEASRRAGADTLLAELPQGLATPLSRRFEGGTDLSGGQWQRIALARAMTAVGAGARVLVLDEPTAHLDVRAEADLYDRFLDLTHGLTTIIISHRFSTVRRADRIVVLDGGRITEDGTHDDLIAADGEYARLFRTQAMRYADAAGDTDG